MKSTWYVAACTLPVFLTALPVRALDFTLSTKSIMEDGYPSQVSCFAYDEQTTVAIRAPAKWKISTTPATRVLTSPSVTGGEVRLEKSPFTPSVPFKDKDLERYRQHALTQAPPGSTELLVTADTGNPLPIFDWTDHEFFVEYTLYGQRFKRSVLFLNLDTAQQLRVTAVGRSADFEQIHEAAYALLHTWQALPSAAKPPR